MEDSPLTRKIRDLETRLDKAMIKYNEMQVGVRARACVRACSAPNLRVLLQHTQSIKKTYEQIVARLTEERVGFDNQLAALERTVAAKGASVCTCVCALVSLFDARACACVRGLRA